MNRVVINLEALQHNLLAIDELIRGYGASWSVVTKAISGHKDILRALFRLGVRSICDTRIDNFLVAEGLADGLNGGLEKWYLRPPRLSKVADVVQHAQISLNSEIGTVEALSREAGKRGLIHKIVAMVELGDLREGMPQGELMPFFAQALSLANIEIVGLGAQVGCVSGLAPTADHLAQLLLYREAIERRFGIKLPVVSAGSTIFLPMLLDNKLPPGLKHFRIGEALYLGTNLITGGQLGMLRDDVVRLEAEIIEIKEKSLIPLGETVESQPFKPLERSDGENSPSQRGLRALISIGQLDTELSGLQPENENIEIAGASSDVAVLNLGPSAGGLKVGDMLRFKTSYSAFVRLLSSKYTPSVVEPSFEKFAASLPPEELVLVPPVLG